MRKCCVVMPLELVIPVHVRTSGLGNLTSNILAQRAQRNVFPLGFRGDVSVVLCRTQNRQFIKVALPELLDGTLL